jgi:Na+-translocating ferredoxin:NAD+ oxidoreductase subunit G
MIHDANNGRSPSAWSSAIVLAVVAAICTALVTVTQRLAAPRIADNQKAYLEQSLRPALAGVFYDNDLSESTLVLPPPHGLPGNETAIIYRLFSEERPVAAVFVVSARGGYSGPIRLLVAIEYSGTLTGVQVLEHNETPGLGDLIEPSRSNWLQQFEQASLEDPPRERWTIRRDGGAFDQLTGASVTPRAVVRAVKETLIYYESNRDSVFARRAEPEAVQENQGKPKSQ